MTITKPEKHRLPYFQNTAQLFAPIADEEWSVFLDSGFPYNEQGRFDIIAKNPVITLLTEGDITTISEPDKNYTSDKDPFELIKHYVNGREHSIDDIPFTGGAIGYFSYDLVRRLETLPVIAKDEENMAEMAVGIYRWTVVVDHLKKQSWLIGNPTKQDDWDSLVDQFSGVSKAKNDETFVITKRPQSNMNKNAYQTAFGKIKHYLKEGDSYQVNLAQRFCSPCTGNPWAVYNELRKSNAAPFSAYLNFPQVQILSSSPERFLKVTAGEVETKPIKGTRPRLADPVEDKKQIAALSKSKKDRAENLMIVDLLRNDISKNCKPGSVKVPHLFTVESFATVHHLVSTIKGVLAEGHHALDLLRNCFPGGSITGAPKIRAMEIIEELEPNRRGIYCGSIGYIGFNGNMDTNIAIRTLVLSENSIRFSAGGGIVNDSVLEEEYQESFDKAVALLDVMEKFIPDEDH